MIPRISRLLSLVVISLVVIGSGSLGGCSSSPKTVRDPAEEQALSQRGLEVIAAGPTPSAKAGGYDPIPFWKDRAGVTKKLTTGREIEVVGKTKKSFLVDFKVRFYRHDISWRGGTKSLVPFREQRAVHALIESEASEFQKITDRLHQDFITRLQDAGYQVAAREAMADQEMKAYLASDNMLVSPQTGADNVWIFAPTGWKLEKSTMEGPSLGAAFGMTLLKLAEQNSRQHEESLAWSVTYDVDLGKLDQDNFLPLVSVKASLDFATTYYLGTIQIEEFLQDRTPYPLSSRLATTQEAPVLTGRGPAAVAEDVLVMIPQWSSLQSHVVQHAGYANDLLFERLRQGRDH